MKTLGIRHIALNVKDPQLSKKFYVEVMKMSVEWEPDPDNVYLTSESQDNLALHKATGANAPQALDHFGYILPTPEDVDSWYDHVKKSDTKIEKEVKSHRDGAKSFYFRDPDGLLIQMIYHPPIADRSNA